MRIESVKLQQIGIATCLIFFTIIVSLSHFRILEGFNSTQDLGNFLQAFWNTWQGRIFEHSLDFAFLDERLSSMNVSRFYYHIEPSLLLISPLVYLPKGAWVILTMQTMSVALAMWVLYRHFDNPFVTLLILLNPFLHRLFFLGDIRGDIWAILCWVCFYINYEKRKWKGAWIFAILFAGCKEYAAYLGLFTCLLFYLSSDLMDRKKSIHFSVFFMAYLWILVPAIRFFARVTGDVPISMNKVYFHGVSESGIRIFYAFIHEFFYLEKWQTSIWLLLPTLSFIYFGKKYLIPLIPIWIALMLSTFAFRLDSHHIALIIPVLWIASFIGYQYLQQTNPRNLYMAKGISLIVTVGILLAHPVSPLSICIRETFLHPQYQHLLRYAVNDHDSITVSALRLIPAEAKLTSPEHLRAAMSYRETNHRLPQPRENDSIDWAIFDMMDHKQVIHDTIIEKRRIKFHLDSRWMLHYFEDGIFVYHRSISPIGLSGYTYQTQAIECADYKLSLQSFQIEQDDSLIHLTGTFTQGSDRLLGNFKAWDWEIRIYGENWMRRIPLAFSGKRNCGFMIDTQTKIPKKKIQRIEVIAGASHPYFSFLSRKKEQDHLLIWKIY